MDPDWNENEPIYRQLRGRVIAMIIEGVLREGDPLPSVRSVNQLAARQKSNFLKLPVSSGSA